VEKEEGLLSLKHWKKNPISYLKNATMKNIFIIIVATVIVSCNTKKSKEPVSKIDTVGFFIHSDSSTIKTDSHYFWSSDLDPKKGLVMLRTNPLPDDSLKATIIIQMLNGQNPEIQLRFSKVSNDSIFVKIDNSNYLTQQTGSSGAEAYLAEVTYNLTELKDIHFVDIRFKAGDHASPATYARTDFIKIKN
jgi:hypothetical protein